MQLVTRLHLVRLGLYVGRLIYPPGCSEPVHLAIEDVLCYRLQRWSLLVSQETACYLCLQSFYLGAHGSLHFVVVLCSWALIVGLRII